METHVQSRLCRRPHHGRCSTALLVALIVGACPISFASDRDLTRISEDPYSDPTAEHRTGMEPSMVAHDDAVVVAFQVGRFFSPELGSDNVGWATSKDAGRTWHHGFLARTTTLVGGQWKGVNVPVTAYDRKHRTYLIAVTSFDADGNGRGVMVSRSEDGLDWSVATTGSV